MKKQAMRPVVAVRNGAKRRCSRSTTLTDGAIQKKFRYRNCISSVSAGVMKRSAHTHGCTPKIAASSATSVPWTSRGFTKPIVSCRFV